MGRLGSLAPVAAVAAAAGGLLALATPGGAGVTPDTVDYVMAARELLAGHGLVVHAGVDGTRPLTHFPPLFPATLALLGLTGSDPLAAARWLNVLLFGVNVALVGVLLRMLDPTSRWLPVLGALLALASPLMPAHALALSEPLFLALGFGGLALLARGLDGAGRSWLALGALGIGLAVLARWAGAAFVAAGAAGALIVPSPSLRRRTGTAALIGLVASLPVLAWLARNRLLGASATGRPLAWHPIGAEHLGQLSATAERWLLLPEGLGLAGLAVVSLVALAVFVWLHRSGRAPRSSGSAALPRLLLLFVASYATLLTVSISLFDYHTPLNPRIMAPALLAVLVLALHGARRAALASGSRVVLAAFLALAGLLLAGHARATLPWLSESLREGQRFFGTHGWRDSPVVARTRELPSGLHVYSNGGDALYMLTGRRASDLPLIANPASRAPNPRYHVQMQEILAQLRARTAVIVWLDRLGWRWYFWNREALVQRYPLFPLATASDGAIFTARRSGRPSAR